MNQVRSLIPNIKEEKIFSFTRDEDGLFRKIEKTIYRDRDTNEIKSGKEITLEGFYRPTLDDDYDEEMHYQEIDGSDQVLKLKLIENES